MECVIATEGDLMDIISMAREAHSKLVTEDYPGHTGQLDPWTLRLCERFAALVLEEAAKVCDARFMGDLNREDMEARACAAAIRALKGAK